MFSKKKNSKTTNYGTNTNDNTRNLEDSSSEEIISLSDHTSYWYAGPRKTTFDIGIPISRIFYIFVKLTSRKYPYFAISDFEV